MNVTGAAHSPLWLEQIEHGASSSWPAVIGQVISFLASFAGLAIVCDDRLVPSLEVFCVQWKIREDVAGASIMAFGSAAPEIVVNAISTLKASTVNPQSVNLGLGAILGSSVIAFSLIPGCCALFAGELIGKLELKRRPLLRDIVAYSLALSLLVHSFAGDGRISTVESGLLLFLYFLYILVVVFSPKIRFLYHHSILRKPLEHQESFVDRQRRALDRRREFLRSSPSGSSEDVATNRNVVWADSFEEQEEVSLFASLIENENSQPSNYDSIPTIEPEEVQLGPVANALVFPIRELILWTCPSCERGSEHEWKYPFTFVLSFGWVAVFSFIVSTIVEHWGELTRFHLSFLGFFLVSIGAEVPDLVQSVTVSRRGYGSMAISNAIGSQICNLCFGLGLPFFISNLSGHPILITDKKHLLFASVLQVFNTFWLALLTLGPVVLFQKNKACLTKRKGIFLLAMYFCIVVAFGWHGG